ncbi:MAG: DUF4136 domain-containing protein [Novosphingobium sp.]|nr:DUF4136 domain-containing protein [Novosphingobium sp.]
MKPFFAIVPAICLAAISGCVAPVGPVEVTRFHLPDTTQLGNTMIAVEPGDGMDGASLEFRTYSAAIARELARVGYSESSPGTAAGGQIALLSFDRATYQPGRRNSPVSVGVGGSTGSYRSGVGLGIGFDLSGPPPEQVETRLSVMIRDRESGKTLWEGRASFAVKANSPLADTQLGAAKMAEALFRDFPGNSGETIQVK